MQGLLSASLPRSTAAAFIHQLTSSAYNRSDRAIVHGPAERSLSRHRACVAPAAWRPSRIVVSVLHLLYLVVCRPRPFLAFYLRAPGSRQDRTYRGGGRSGNDTPDSHTLTHRDGGSVKCLVCRGAVVGSGVKVDRVDDLFSGSPMEGDRDAHRVVRAERARAPWGGEFVVSKFGAVLRAELVE